MVLEHILRVNPVHAMEDEEVQSYVGSLGDLCREGGHGDLHSQMTVCSLLSFVVPSKT